MKPLLVVLALSSIVASAGTPPATDLPLMEYHVHLKGDFTLEQTDL